MCDCFHLAFPNWHAASSGTGAGRRLRAPEPGTEDDSVCDEPSQFTEGERPRPQGSSPVEEYPETEKYTDSDKECEAEHDPHHKSGSGKRTKKSGLGSMFEKRSTPKMSKLKEVPSPESGVIVKTAKDGCAEGLIYGGGGKEGIFIKEVVPESPASKSLKLKEGDQVLSATVYFDNVSYEDAIQILEHAQAYKVKLCLKRKPDITETESAIESDVIPEEDIYAPEMREQGKSKRRGDARISWPKFPSFGKGRKSRFTRSHSSSEADEQRKLELSPTTSDTESPIKSQDALKGKKRHKIKLSLLTKRGRISSSEDQDTDTPTTGQIIQTHDASDMLSPECLESPSGETPEIYVTGDRKVVEDLRLGQNDQKLTEPQTVQHKVELITIDSTLKTEDLTVALADKDSSSGIKSPDGKKKKKERSELKMKILGKDKGHKKDAKAKSSPKRLKTLGASIEIPDQPEKSAAIPSSESHTKLQDQLAPDDNTRIISSESSRVISAKSVTTQMEMSVPKVELDIPDVSFIRKSPQKGEQKMKDIKQETKTGPTFKLPRIGLGDLATEETIQKMNVNVEECTTKMKQLTTEGTEVKEDPYERLAKSSLSRIELPKREEIEIPGMEDMSRRTTARGIKEPKAGFKGHYEEIQAEAVQMSIDVDSVKEAVSKLPGFKLPKVDTSGVPIPEEIIVIDANAQRISVKTPTKVVDTKTKYETHFITFDTTASPEISKTTVKLPKIPPALTSEELLIETQVDLKKPEKKSKTNAKQSDKEIKTGVYKREDIIIPGKESAPGVAIIQAQDTEGIKSDYDTAATLSPKESEKKSKKAKITASFGIAKPDIKIPDIGIDLPKQNIYERKVDGVKGEKTEARKGKGQTGGVISDVKIPEIDGIEYIDSVGGSPNKKDGGSWIAGFGVSLDATKPNANISFPDVRDELEDVSVNVPDVDKDIHIDGAEIQTLEREGKVSKFKMPNLGISIPKVKGPKMDLSLSKKDVDVTLPETKAEVRLPEVPEVDVTLGNVTISEQKMEVEKPEFEIKPMMREGELDGQGGKFKMPKLGIKMPKMKGPEFDLSISKKDIDVKQTDAKAEGKIPKAPEIDVSFGSVDASIPQQKMKVKTPELENKPLQTDGELDGQGSRFKMPKLGIAMPKVKGPEMDFSLSKKDVDVTLPEAKAEVKLPDVELKEHTAKVEIKAPEFKGAEKDVEGSPSKFKMPSFKLPKFGVGTPHVSVKVPDMDKDVKIDGADINIPEEQSAVNIASPEVDIEGPSIDMKTIGTEQDGKGGKFKMPHLGFSMPKVKGPKIDLSLPKRDVDVTLPEAKADVKLPEAPKISVEMKSPECEAEMDGHDGKIKIPKFEVKMPKVKGPEFDLRSSKKDVDVQLPETKADVKLPEVDLGKVDVSIPKAKMEVQSPELEMQSLQTDGELDGQGERFKMPKFGIKMPKVKGPEFDLSLSKKDMDVTLPQTKAEVKLPDAPKIDVSLGKAEVLTLDAKAEVEKPELKMKSLRTEVEGQGSKFKMPKFGMAMPKVKGPEFHLGFSKKDVDVTLPEAKVDVNHPDVELKEPSAKVEIKAPDIAKVEVKKPEVEIKPLQTDVELEGQGGKFKMPKFGITMPKVKGPEIDLSFSKKDVAVILPEAKAEVELPEAPKIAMDMKPPECEAEIDGQGSRFKMPKFGITMPKVKGPEIDLSLSKKDVDVTLPEAKAEVKLPEAPKIAMEMKPPECEAEIDGQGSKFKMPKFGITMPKVKGPEIDLSFSKKDVDVTLPEAKAEVKLPDAELKEPSAKVEIKLPETEAQLGHVEGSASKFKLPTFKFPKFGAATPNVSAEVPDIDTKVEGAGMNIDGATVAAQNIDIEAPSLDVKMTGTEGKGKESKFKVPKFGISLPKVQGPEIDVNFSKKDVKLPEAKAEVKLPETPEIDINLGKVDVSIPEAKLEVKKPELEMKPLQSEGELGGEGSKFKMPKFGMSMPKVKGPEIDVSLSKKDVEITLPEAKADVNLPDVELKEPSAKVEMKASEIEAQLHSVKGSPSKFKMPTFKFPKFGVTAPTVSTEVPDIDKEIKIDDMHISVPQTDVDVQEIKTEISLPEAEVKEPSGGVVIDQPGVEVDAKLKKRRFSLPRFSFSKSSVKSPEVDVSLPDVNAAIPEGKVEVKGGDVDTKLPECEAELDGQGSKFKMPKFGITMPKVTGPEIDISLTKKDVDVTLPEAKAEVKLPDTELKEPSAEVEIKAPEFKVVTKDTEASPSKFKMPTFKLPKFGVGMPSADIEVPDTNKDVTIDGADIKIPEEVHTVEIVAPSIDTEGPSIDMKTKGTEHEGKGTKFKMPKFGITMPKVTGPEFDLSLSKKDVDVSLPEAEAEVKVPDAELKQPSAAVEIKAPEFKVVTKDTGGSPSKFKMPTFKLPKFGSPSATVEMPDADKDIKIDGADIKIPEEVLTVEIAAPSIDTEGPSIDMKTIGTEHEGKGSKFKMPKFGITMPKIAGPEIDLSLSKTDVAVTLPEAKAEVNLPDVELKEPSAEVEIKAPEFKVVTKDTGGSPSKFKMPTFKLPKFGSPTATVEMPDADKDIKIDGADNKIPEEVLTVEITAPSIDTEGPSIDMKTTGTEHEGKGSKFKMPSLGFSVHKVKQPDIDLSVSKKDVDVTLPEAKADVKLPDVELKESPAKVEMKAPEIDVQAGYVEGSPSKFKMPTFKLPKFGAATSQVSVEVPDSDKDITVTVDGTDLKLPQTKAEVKLPDIEVKEPVGSILLSPVTEGDAKLKKPRFSLPKFSFSKQSTKETGVDVSLPGVDVSLPEVNVEVKQPEVELKPPEGDVELDGQGSKFKMPKFGISMPKVKGPEIDLSLSKKDVDVTLPEAKAEMKPLDVEIKQPSAKVEIKAPEIEAQTGYVEGSPSKLKMPTFTLPKFGTATPKVSVEVPDVDKDIKIDGEKMEVTKEGATVVVTAPSIDTEGLSVDVKATGGEIEGAGSKFKMPKFGISIPKVKGPEIDLSLTKKDADATLPEVKAEVKLPDVQIKEPEVAISVPDAPAVEAEAKMKRPNWTFPKFSFSRTGGKAPQVDVELDKPKVDVTSPEAKAEVCLPDVEVQGPLGSISMEAPPAAELDANLKKTKFSLPKFSFSKSGVKEPDVSTELPNVDVSLPEVNVEVKKTDVELKPPEGDVELHLQESKFKMPKFGISIPKVKGPEIDLSLSKKGVDVTLPEAEVEVQHTDVKIKQPSAKVEIKAPEIEAQAGIVEGSPSKLKMPTFTLPKFGAATPKVSVEVPNMGKDIKIDGATLEVAKEGAKVDVAAPSIDTEGLSVDVKAKGGELEGAGSKFKMPSFGISMPKVKGPEIDLSLSKRDTDIKLPEAKTEVKVPDVELKEPSAEVEIKAPEFKVVTKDTGGSPSKFKMPTFKLPKFGSPSATVEMPDADKGIKIDGADIKIPEEVLTVEIAAPSIDTEGPSIDMKTTGTEHEGKGSKFKMPSLGFSVHKVKQPDTDLSLSKKDVDVTLPEAKADVKLPDVELKESSAKVEMKAPEIDVQAGHVEGSPSKFKMPTFKLPKFGAATSQVSVEVPDLDKDITVTVDGADLKLPQTKAEVKLPDVEVKEPVGSILLSPVTEGDAKLKKPRFSLPKFSFSKQSTKETVVDVSLPGVDVSLPEVNVEVKQPEVELKPPEGDVELDGQGSKFKMPKFGISIPKVKGPEIDLSLSKKDVDVTLPEVKAEMKPLDVKIKQPSAKVEIKAPEIEAPKGNVEGSPSKLKMPTFTLPKFGAATPKVSVEVPDVDKDIKIDGTKPEAPTVGAKVDVTVPSIDTEGMSVDVKAKGSEIEGSGSKFKMPKFGISMPKVKGPEIDLSMSKKDVDVTLPEAKAEIKAPEIEAQTGYVEGSPSKLKMPTFTLPKFGTATPKVSVEVPDVDKDIKIDGEKMEVTKAGATVVVTAPSIDTEGLSVDVKAKGGELEGAGSKFKMPSFGISMPKVKGPEIDLSLTKKDVDITLPEVKAEVKLPDVEVKEPEVAISVPDAPSVEAEAKMKRPNWTFPKFSFSRTGGKSPDVDVNLETPKVDVTSPEVKAEVSLPDIEVQGPSGSMEEPPAAELDANLKKTKFSLPKFSFSKSGVKEPEVSTELPHVDVSLPEGEVKVKQPEMEIKAPELDAEHDGQGSKFKLPKFGITLPKAKGPEGDLSQKDVDITLPEVKAEVKVPEAGVKSSASVEIKAGETETKSKDVGGSPSKFKKPTIKMPKIGGATHDVTVEAPELKEDVSVNIKGLTVDIKTDVSKAATTDTETPKTETDTASLGSPSKFKLPSFKMPKLSFSRSKPEDGYSPVETEYKDDKMEMEVEPKGEIKSPKMSLTSFGEILKNIDVEFDVSKNLETSKEVHERDEPSEKQLEAKEKETNTKQDTTKSPEKTGWFKFPKFGLSSPTEPAKISEKDRHKDEKSPVGELVDEEISPTCSVQSSDAFADISSAMTSEHLGLSLSSPTKVTVKYSDPNTATGLGEMHSNIITSTTRSELISVEPNLPEKITILSSGVSSSSEDTLRLESGKIHVITSNIQATPESLHAKLLTAVQVQPAGGLPLQSEANESASWTVEDSQGSKRTVIERHVVRETSSERSEGKETIVITKQITHRFDSSEPISGDTASSIQRLRDSVHSEKMKFFDGAKK